MKISSIGLSSLLPPQPFPLHALHPVDPQAPHPLHALKPLQPLNRLAGTAPHRSAGESPKKRLVHRDFPDFLILNILGGISTSSTAQGSGGSFKNRKPIGEVGCCESRMAERIH